MSQLMTLEQVSAECSGIRRCAKKLLAYYLVCLPVTVPLALLEWIGEKAEAALDWIDGPAYRLRSQQEEHRRALIRDARRRKSLQESEKQNAPGVVS